MGGKAIAVCLDCDIKAERVYWHRRSYQNDGQYEIVVYECSECNNVGVRVKDHYQSPPKIVCEEGRIKVKLIPFDKVGKYER